MENYHFKYEKLKRKVNLLEVEVEDLNEYVELDKRVDKKTVVNIIEEIVLSIIDKKGPKGIVHKDSSYSSESFKNSDLVEIIKVRE